jgi:hypothetical protein
MIKNIKKDHISDSLHNDLEVDLFFKKPYLNQVLKFHLMYCFFISSGIQPLPINPNSPCAFLTRLFSF